MDDFKELLSENRQQLADDFMLELENKLKDYAMELRIKDLSSKVGSGVTPRGGAEVYQETGIPLYRSQNVTDDGFITEGIAHISKEIDEEMSGTRIKPGDVLLNITGASIGRCYYTGDNFKSGNVNQHVCIIRPKRNIVIPAYLHLLLVSKKGKDYIKISQTGSGREGLTSQVIRNFSFDIPSLSVQQHIVSYLDDKTAKIDHAVSLLQKKRDAYTRLKASIINRAVTCGLNHNVKLKDSGVDWIGMIPENWEVRRIKDVGFMKSGDVIRKEQLEDDGKYCVYGANSLIGHSNMFNVNGNVLTIGRVGSCGVVRQIVEPTFISDNALILYNIRGCINYMFFTLKSAKLERLNESIAQPLITATKVKGVFIPYPPLPEQQIIASYLDTHCSRIDHAISIVDKQIDAYTRLKKSLINEVVTGKRKV